jgi:hypothetical protein
VAVIVIVMVMIFMAAVWNSRWLRTTTRCTHDECLRSIVKQQVNKKVEQKVTNICSGWIRRYSAKQNSLRLRGIFHIIYTKLL